MRLRAHPARTRPSSCATCLPPIVALRSRAIDKTFFDTRTVGVAALLRIEQRAALLRADIQQRLPPPAAAITG